MGSIILGTGISTEKSILSSVQHAIVAAQNCLTQANVQAEDVALIINTGVFRDKNIVEPAMALLIQKELGMNSDYVKAGTGKNAFGLDLINGGIGTLNAFKVADSFVQSGATRYALIVSGDTHPSHQPPADFPYTTVGSAILIGKNTDERRGFQGFAFQSEKHEGQGRVAYLDGRNMGDKGRDLMTIETASGYFSAALKLAERVAKSLIEKAKLDVSEIQIVSSQLSAQFAIDLGRAIGAAPESSPKLFESYGDTHSSSFGLGFHTLQKEGRTKKGSKVLFVGAAAGIDSGAAFYVC